MGLDRHIPHRAVHRYLAGELDGPGGEALAHQFTRAMQSALHPRHLHIQVLSHFANGQFGVVTPQHDFEVVRR